MGLAAAAWWDAEAAAYRIWRIALDEARRNFESAAEQAWESFGQALSSLITDLANTVSDLESGFNDAVIRAERDWRERELAAWESYLHAYSQLLGWYPNGARRPDVPVQIRLDAGVSVRDLEQCCCCLDNNPQAGTETPADDEVPPPTLDLLLPSEQFFSGQGSAGGGQSCGQDPNSHIDYYPLGMSLIVSADLSEQHQSSNWSNWFRRYVLSGLQMLGGALEMVGGAGLLLAPEPTSMSKAASAVLWVHGWDNLLTGWHNMCHDDDRPTMIEGILRSGYEFVLPPEHAEKAALYTDIGLSLWAGSVSSAKALDLRRTYQLTGSTWGPVLTGDGRLILANRVPRDLDVVAPRIWQNDDLILGSRVGPRLPPELEGRMMFNWRRFFNPVHKLRNEWRARVFGDELGLLYRENLGGHTIRKHVLDKENGKWVNHLRQRLVNEPGLKYANGFRSLDEAERVIGEVLEANRGRIRAWLHGSDDKPLELIQIFQESVGLVLQNGAHQTVLGHQVRVVLTKDSGSKLGLEYIRPIYTREMMVFFLQERR